MSTTLSKLLLVVVGLSVATACAQDNPPKQPTARKPIVPQWQIAAGGEMSFDVASVRQDKTNVTPSMNVNPTLDDSFTPTGGLYVAKNIVLAQFVAFAYKLTIRQLVSFQSQVPWSKQDQFDIEARAEGNPTKDQYRLMMQSLLADRFKMKVHFETREAPLYALVVDKPGRLGPQLRLHRGDDPVCASADAALPNPPGGRFAADAEGFPLACMGPLGMVPSAPGLIRLGGRDVPMARLAAILPGVGEVDRPLVDETGLEGTVDFFLEWKQRREWERTDSSSETNTTGPPFDQALKEQLGIKMVSKRGPTEFFVVDHIEHPSPN